LMGAGLLMLAQVIEPRLPTTGAGTDAKLA
jgi:hypothetical protein